MPEFYTTLARKMPEFFIIIARKIVSRILGGHAPVPPAAVSYAYVLACICSGFGKDL